ncbi:hypothetical protein FACS1894219_03640 [Clostridia bacterium]|nr:hypothetical protein FACS1894219_03640 [Clostridia bacterium]
MADRLSSVNDELQGIHGKLSEDETDSEANFPYIIFRVFQSTFAISCKYVISIEEVAPTTDVAGADSAVRGIAYYKNEAITMYDAREIFGYMSEAEYIRDVVNIPGAIDYYSDLISGAERSIAAGTSQVTAYDPQECPFGKWFYSYKTETLVIRSALEKVGLLHEKIHKSAANIAELIGDGYSEEASLAVTELRENILPEIKSALNKLADVMGNNKHEISLILRIHGKKTGLIVDTAENVERITDIQPLPDTVVCSDYVKRMGLRLKDRSILLLIEAEELNFT